MDTPRQQDTKGKIDWIVESLLEELIEKNLKDFTSVNSSNYDDTIISNSNNVSFQNTSALQQPFLSTILINEQGLKSKIILFKLNSVAKGINSGVGIMIAFLTEGFYGCELITIFNTDESIHSLQNKIRQEYTNQINLNTTHVEYSQENEFSNSSVENFVLDYVFSHIVEPVADIIIPFYNHLFSHCKKSNLLLRNNLILLLPDILEDIDNHEDNFFAILCQSITSPSCVIIQHLIPTAIKAPILAIRMLNRDSLAKIQSRGLMRYLLQEGFNNERFPITYWNSFAMLNRSFSCPTYKDHYEKAQQSHTDFYTLSQLVDFFSADHVITNNNNTTDYSSSYLKISSDVYPQPITVFLSTVNDQVTINLPLGVHEYLIRSLNEANLKQDHFYNGIFINCGFNREFIQDLGYLLSDGSLFTKNNSKECSNWSFSSLRFDWCFDLQSDQIEISHDTLIVKCCPNTMEDVLHTLYYQNDFNDRVSIFSNSLNSEEKNSKVLLMIKWDRTYRQIYYFRDSYSNQTFPIDCDIFSLGGIDFDNHEFKYNDSLLYLNIVKIILLSPPIHFSTRINAENMVKLVEFIFNIIKRVLSKNPTLPLEVLERFDIIIHCQDYGYVTFDLNSYYEKNIFSFKLKKDWIDHHLNVRKVLKEFISIEQLFSFVGPKLSFCIQFQINS